MTEFDRLQLPPELWIRILEFAAILPGQLDTDVQDPFNNPYALPLPYVVAPESARTSLAAMQLMRASLAHVSRLWNAVATPHLYESVYVGSNAMLVSLASTLRHSHLYGTSRGQSIHRLDLMMIDADGPSPEAFKALEAVFSCLPNLTILNICTSAREPTYAPRSVLCVLRDTCAASLKSFSWDPISSLRPTMYDMQGMLCAFTRLRTLGRLHWPDCDGYMPGCPYGLPVFSKLRCISLPHGHDDHGCPPPRFAALQQIVVGSTAPGGCIDAFIRDHAERLRIAYIEVVAEEQSLAAFMDCPMLEHLVLYMGPDMVRALSCWRLPPTVTHLGVHVGSRSGASARRDLVVLLGHLSSVDAQRLQVVRLLHLTRRELAEFLRTDGFALAYDTLTRKGWVLEDRVGCRLSPSRRSTLN